jgi:branched-chain amino acid aminotransferase
MNEYIFYKDRLVPVQQFGLSWQNRSFRYGDGFFESIRCFNGQPLWIDYHYERIYRSAKTLHIDLPEKLNPDGIKDLVSNLLNANKHLSGARVRMSFFRESGGLYKPIKNGGLFIIESAEIDTPNYALNKNGFNVGVYNEIAKPINKLSFIKSSSSLFYVMASLFGGENGWDEVIILNEHGNVAEAGNSNIFMVEKGKLLTPALDQGCVDGVMRRVILDLAGKKKLKVSECSFLPGDLLNADEVFFTNAIRGIQWVKGIQNKRYYHQVASELMLDLQKVINSR